MDTIWCASYGMNSDKGNQNSLLKYKNSLWIGIKPTHKRLTFTGVDIDKVVNGKIVEHGGAVNTFDTLFEHHLIKPV